MTIEVYQGGTFQHEHERRAVDRFVGSLREKLGNSASLYIVLADYSLGGKSIDLTVLKNDAIVIVELKSESVPFTVTEGLWPTADGRHVGGYYSPLVQTKDYRTAWKELLKKKSDEVKCFQHLDEIEIDKTTWHSRCMVVIDPVVPDGVINDLEIVWFRLCGLDEAVREIEFAKSKGFNFSDIELRTIARTWLGLSGPFQELTVELQKASGQNWDSTEKPITDRGNVRPIRQPTRPRSQSFESAKVQSPGDKPSPSDSMANSTDDIQTNKNSKKKPKTAMLWVIGAVLATIASAMLFYKPGNKHYPEGAQFQSSSVNESSASKASTSKDFRPSPVLPAQPGISSQSGGPASPGVTGETGQDNVDNQEQARFGVSNEARVSSGELTQEDLQARYLRASVRNGFTGNDYPNWAIVAWTYDGKNPSLYNQIVSAMEKDGVPQPLELFTDRFFQDGSANRVLAGEEDLLFMMNLGNYIDYLVLAKSSEELMPPGKHRNISSVKSEIELRVFSMNGVEAPLTLHASEVGTGFDENDATEQATRAAIESIYPRLKSHFADFY